MKKLRIIWQYIPTLLFMGLLMIFAMRLSGWIGVIARIILVPVFLYATNWGISGSMKEWNGIAKAMFLIAAQLLFLCFYLLVIWRQMAGEYTEPLYPFLQNIRVLSPAIWTLIINPNNIAGAYLGVSDTLLTLLSLAGLTIAASAATVVGVNYKKMDEAYEDYYHTYWHEGKKTSTITYNKKRHVQYIDGKPVVTHTTTTERIYDYSGWVTTHVVLNDPTPILFVRSAVILLGYLIVPLPMCAAVLIYYLWKLIPRTWIKVIASVTIAAAVVSIYLLSGFSDTGESVSRIYEPTTAQVRAGINGWNEQASELLGNYSLKIKRLGALNIWSSYEMKQIMENGRTLRYYNIEDTYLTWKGEYWVVTDTTGTVIYRKNDDDRLVYRAGTESYTKLIGDLNAVTLDEVTKKWLPFYADEQFVSVTNNQANETKLLLIRDREEFNIQGFDTKIEIPPDFYLTDNAVTIMEFYQYSEWFRAEVEYGAAGIILPDDIGEYRG